MVFLLLFLSIGSHSIHETICVFRVIFSNSEKQSTKHSQDLLTKLISLFRHRKPCYFMKYENIFTLVGFRKHFSFNVLLCYALPCMFLLLFDTYRCMIIMMRFKMTWLEWLKHYFLLYYFFSCTLHYKSSINYLFNQIDCISWSKFSKYGVHMHVKAWRCNSAKVSGFSYSILSTINLGSCLYDI